MGAPGGRVDALLPRVARELGLRVVAPLAGGEFGATLVRDAGGRELVLKALPSAEFAPRFARGAEMAGRMRARGYPAPRYEGTGAVEGAAWSLQERLPGAVPDVMSERHAVRLLELVGMHAGAAGRSARRQAATVVEAAGLIARVEQHEETRPIACELAAVIERYGGRALIEDSVVHRDFHHRNYLAIGDEVTGVIDWELAGTGDWRADLVTLAFWSALLPAQIPPGAARIVIERMEEVCPPDVLALLAARMTLRQLDFDVRVHPERLPAILPGLERSVARWWRAAM